MSDFATFWATYPRKIGKLAAMKAYAKALKLAAPDVIIRGVELYVRTKPPYCDFCHPATFLNQGRWLDEPDVRSGPATGWTCRHVPPCHDKFWCQSGARDERERMRGAATQTTEEQP